MGYPSGWSVRAGTPVEFMVSASASYQAEIIRVTGRGPRPDGEGPALSCERVPSEVDGTYPATWYQTVSGSYAETDEAEPSPSGDASVSAWAYPTLPALGRWQSILTWLTPDGRPGLALGLTGAGLPALRYWREDGTAGELRGPQPLAARQWHFVAASISAASGQVVLLHQPRARAARGSGIAAEPAVVSTSQDGLRAAPLGHRVFVARCRPDRWTRQRSPRSPTGPTTARSTHPVRSRSLSTRARWRSSRTRPAARWLTAVRQLPRPAGDRAQLVGPRAGLAGAPG